jgi:hypothetical protein
MAVAALRLTADLRNSRLFHVIAAASSRGQLGLYLRSMLNQPQSFVAKIRS